MIMNLLTDAALIWCFGCACWAALVWLTPVGKRLAEHPSSAPVPRDPAGWGWISDAERRKFEAIEAAETTGGGER